MHPQDVKFLEQHPDLASVDLLLPDLNGVLRGKRLHGKDVEQLFAEGIQLPASLFAAAIYGATVEETGLGFDIGDADRRCVAVPGSLKPVPWMSRGAQALITMLDEHGNELALNPRALLARTVAGLQAQDLHPVVAVELEFYLLQGQLDDRGCPRVAINPATGQPEKTTQVYHIRDLDDFQPFLSSVQALVEAQGVGASAASSEYAPGQFEINLEHRDDPVAACDEALMLKRLIKAAAREHGLIATFMAKPFLELSGSGTHVHASLYDGAGDNWFAAQPDRLHHAIGGLEASMKSCQLLCAPHANSFRRFQPEAFVPLSPCWGYNNRTVALRVPESPDAHRRIEHRLAGADANPYLVTALVLAGMAHGMDQQLQPSAPLQGDANAQLEPDLHQDWLRAIDDFEANTWAREAFGESFCRTFVAIKRAEHRQFQAQITPLEMIWTLTNP